MKIWFISIFEQTPIDESNITRFNTIAKHATDLGHDITYFASTFKHNTKNQRFSETETIQLEDNFEMVYLKSHGYKKNISVKRLLSHYKYSKDLLKLLKKRSNPDVILVAFPPISLAYEITKWGKENNVPVIVDVIDPWPDLFRVRLDSYPDFLLNLIFKPLNNKVNATFNNATAITAISNQYLTWANSFSNSNKENLKVFYPALPVSEMRKSLKSFDGIIDKDDNFFTVIYAGSLASSYDIPTILDAAKSLKGENIKFIIAGAGPQEALIQEYINGGAGNLSYIGRVPQKELLKEYFKADLGLTQHIKGATQTVTYKLFDLLACGLPILNSLESEMNDIIVKNKVGLFNAPGDSDMLAENILFFKNNPNKLYAFKENAINLASEIGEADIVYKEFVHYLTYIAKISKN